MWNLSGNQAQSIAGWAEIYDISASLQMVASYPGDRPFSLDWLSRIEHGAGYNLSALTLCSHAGTHLDAPAHLLKDARSIDQYPVSRFILPAQVIPVPYEWSIKPSALQGIDARNGEAWLFKTNNSAVGLLRNRCFKESYVYLSEEAARLCVALGAGLVGIDCLSVDRYGDDAAPAHHILLENDVLILEGIDLWNVPPGRYLLICLPLKIAGAEASPVRAVLVR